jgi:hypothetical protein
MQIQNNQYSYIDSKNRYTLNNGVLRNIANIEDEKVLLVFESLQVSKRLEELFFHPININDSSALLKIQYHPNQNLHESSHHFHFTFDSNRTIFHI